MRGLTKPKALQPGQTVGLVAPSSAVERPEALDEAIASLQAQGYGVKVAENCRARHAYFAGTDAQRADGINRMFRDDTVDAVLCVRGGYGATRLLEMIDYDAIQANPKVFCGYSDITALHSAMQAKSGLVTFHGLMATSDMAEGRNDPFSLASFHRALGSAGPLGRVDNPPDFTRTCIAPGKAAGPLIGGNLTLVTACLGTPYAYDFDGAILFLEEVHERNYSVDRMLTQLARAGALGRLAGILLGEFTDRGPDNPHDLPLPALFEELLTPLGVPVLAGVRCGHVTPNLTLPLGAWCEVDADAETFSIAEAAVV